MIYILIIAVIVAIVIHQKNAKKESSTYDYYKREYDSYMKEKNRNSRPKRSLCLLIAFLLSVAYFCYTCIWVAQGTSPNMDEWEMLGWLAGVSLLIPHEVCFAIAALFNLLSWVIRSRSCALVCAVLYAVSIVLMPLYFMFVIVQMTLSFVGFALMKRPT